MHSSSIQMLLICRLNYLENKNKFKYVIMLTWLKHSISMKVVQFVQCKGKPSSGEIHMTNPFRVIWTMFLTPFLPSSNSFLNTVLLFCTCFALIFQPWYILYIFLIWWHYGKYISIDVERTPPVFANIYLATMSNGMPSGNLAKPHFIMQFSLHLLISRCS